MIKNKKTKLFSRGKICLISMMILILALRKAGDKGFAGYFLFCLPLAVFSLISLLVFLLRNRDKKYNLTNLMEILFYILTIVVFLSVYLLSDYGVYIIG